MSSSADRNDLAGAEPIGGDQEKHRVVAQSHSRLPVDGFQECCDRFPWQRTRQLFKPIEPGCVDLAIQSSRHSAVSREKPKQTTYGSNLVLQSLHDSGVCPLERCTPQCRCAGRSVRETVVFLKMLEKTMRRYTGGAKRSTQRIHGLRGDVRILVAQNRRRETCRYLPASSDHADGDQISFQCPYGSCIVGKALIRCSPAIVENCVGQAWRSHDTAPAQVSIHVTTVCGSQTCAIPGVATWRRANRQSHR